MDEDKDKDKEKDKGKLGSTWLDATWLWHAAIGTQALTFIAFPDSAPPPAHSAPSPTLAQKGQLNVEPQSDWHQMNSPSSLIGFSFSLSLPVQLYRVYSRSTICHNMAYQFRRPACLPPCLAVFLLKTTWISLFASFARSTTPKFAPKRAKWLEKGQLWRALKSN